MPTLQQHIPSSPTVAASTQQVASAVLLRRRGEACWRFCYSVQKQSFYGQVRPMKGNKGIMTDEPEKEEGGKV